jgi:tight adherence protein B
MTSVIAGVVFLAVAAIVLIINASTAKDPTREILLKRLEAIRRAKLRGHESTQLNLVRDELLSKVPILQRVLMRWAWPEKVQTLIDQSGAQIRVGRVVLLSLVLCEGIELILSGLFSIAAISLAGALIGLALPLSWIALKRRRRMRTFEKSFPDALDLLARAVRAGHSFTSGLEMMGTEMPDPVGTEFRTTFEEQNFGLLLQDALMNLVDRMPLLDVRFFVTALLLQKETGGNLSEILNNLAKVIRERFRIQGEVRTRTAQGRLSALVLISLPLFMMVALNVLNPAYVAPLYHDPWGQVALVIGFLAQIVGTMIIWKIVSIKV